MITFSFDSKDYGVKNPRYEWLYKRWCKHAMFWYRKM